MNSTYLKSLEGEIGKSVGQTSEGEVARLNLVSSSKHTRNHRIGSRGTRDIWKHKAEQLRRELANTCKWEGE
jgi:hypothetical protein